MAILGSASVLSLVPCLDNGFADDAHLIDGQRHWGEPERFGWMWTSFSGGRYQPLAWMSWELDRRLWEFRPGGYHLSSLVLHAINGVLVYWLGLTLIRGGRRAAPEVRPTGADHAAAGLGGLLFAVHPLRVEAVAWAWQRGIVLSTLFLLVAVLFYLGAARRERAWPWHLAALAGYGLSLLSGPLGVALPVALVVLDGYPLRRLARGARGVWLEKLPYLALAAAGTMVGCLARQQMPSVPSLSAAEHLVRTVYGLAFHAWKTVWPFDLSPLYEFEAPVRLVSWKYLGTVTGVAGAVLLLMRLGRRAPAIGVAATCYVLALLATAGLMQSSWEAGADRYAYLASIPGMLLAGAGMAGLAVHPARSVRWTAPGVFLIAVGLGVGLGWLTRQQCPVWRDPLSLWEYASRKCPKSGVATYRLAQACRQQGEWDRALQLLRAAVGLRPSLLEAQWDLGNALMEIPRIEEAIGAYRAAVALAPGSPQIRIELANALAAGGQFEEAERQLRQAIALAPSHIAPRRALGHLFLSRGRPDQAVETFQAAIELAPARAELHYDLGRAYLAAGCKEAAAAAFQEVLRIDPSHGAASRALRQVTGEEPGG